jgi:hypothetical protein
MNKNQNIRIYYTSKYCNVVSSFDKPVEKIWYLFEQSIKSVGRGNLDNQGTGSRAFRKYLLKIKNKNKIYLKDFLSCFSDLPEFTISDLFNLFISNEQNGGIKGMYKKTCALFLRDLYYGRREIFEDKKLNFEEHLLIPVDIVIIIMLNKIFKLENNNQKFKRNNFDIINDFAKKKLGRKHMLIEDLWFWGFFLLKGSGEHRNFELNESKIQSDLCHYQIDKFRNKLNEFYKKFRVKLR